MPRVRKFSRRHPPVRSEVLFEVLGRTAPTAIVGTFVALIMIYGLGGDTIADDYAIIVFALLSVMYGIPVACTLGLAISLVSSLVLVPYRGRVLTFMLHGAVVYVATTVFVFLFLERYMYVSPSLGYVIGFPAAAALLFSPTHVWWYVRALEPGWPTGWAEYQRRRDRVMDVMPKVIADISISLDGFVTGPNAGPGNGLGDGGEPIHRWVFDGVPVNQRVLREAAEQSGAVVMGRNLFDVIDAPDGWNDEIGYGANHAAKPSFFVVTHSVPEHVRLTNLDFTFVTDGLRQAVDLAKQAADGKDVYVMGGGDIIRQAVDAHTVDVLRVHISPIVLGQGTPLFSNNRRRELHQVNVEPSASATHITYEL